ncbi:MFS transporter [Nonomuraea salmonea]
MATVVLLFPEGPRRSRALSVWAAVASCGLVLGFVLSGVITAHLGWRWTFLISVPVILVVIVAALLLVESDRPVTRPGPLDLPGALLLTACPLLFVYGVVQAGEPGASPWVSVVALAGAALAGAAFVRVEARSPHPLVPLSFFAHRARVTANIATTLLSGALSTSFLLFTFYLQDVRGVGPLEAGLTMLSMGVAMVVASLLVPRLLGRWGARVCVLAGLGCTAGAMAVIALVAVLGAGAPWLIAAMVLIAAGMGFGLIGLQYLAVSGATDEDAGIASGIQRGVDQLGGAAGVTVYVGIGFAPALHSANPFVTAAGLSVIGLIAAALVIRRLPQHVLN